MNNIRKATFIILILLFALSIQVPALDFDTLSGSVYDSSWGPVYLLRDSEGNWVFAYTYSDGMATHYGVMEGSVSQTDSSQTYDLIWIEYDQSFENVTSGKALLIFKGGLTFSGDWFNSKGEKGGVWSGSFIRTMTEEDLTLAKKILRASGY